MPATHHIDNKNKLIITMWNGEPTAGEFLDALNNYQKNIKSNPDFVDYNELVDLSEIKGFKLNSDSLKILGNIAADSDKPGANIKLAIVVSTTLTYGFARMYETYRNLNPRSNKIIGVFKKKSEALTWIDKQNNLA